MFTFSQRFKSPGQGVPYVERVYNENLSSKYNPAAQREMTYGQRREAAVVRALGPLGYPNMETASVTTIQIFMRPPSVYNRSGVPGRKGDVYGLLEGD